MPGYERSSPSSLTEFDSVLTSSNISPDSGRKTQSGSSSMSDREESYECYGEGGEVDCDSDSTPPKISDEVDSTSCRLQSPPHSLPPSNFVHRNTWSRRSLRGSPSSLMEGRLSNKTHRQLFYGGVCASSPDIACSYEDVWCTSDEPDYDVKKENLLDINKELEDDPVYLYDKVQMLQQQVGVLAENQVNTDDRYSRVRQDNAALLERVSILEEQLREAETRGEDRLADEQRRNKELIARVEREKQLTIENYLIKHSNLEKDTRNFSDENQRMKTLVEKLQKDNSSLENRLSETEFTSSALQQDNSKMADVSRRDKEELRLERERSSQVIEELKCEVERLRAVEDSFRKRSPSIDFSPHQAEMENEVKKTREENKKLSDQIEDLQAQLLTTQLEEGRTLVSAANNNSLAAEFEQMTNEELRKSLKDSQEANHDLRAYIDDILLNIVENYPQLLEVKRK